MTLIWLLSFAHTVICTSMFQCWWFAGINGLYIACCMLFHSTDQMVSVSYQDSMQNFACFGPIHRNTYTSYYCCLIKINIQYNHEFIPRYPKLNCTIKFRNAQICTFLDCINWLHKLFCTIYKCTNNYLYNKSRMMLMHLDIFELTGLYWTV